MQATLDRGAPACEGGWRRRGSTPSYKEVLGFLKSQGIDPAAIVAVEAAEKKSYGDEAAECAHHALEGGQLAHEGQQA